MQIQIYTSEVYTRAAEKSFDLYFLEDRMSSSIFEKYGKNGIIRSSAQYVEGETFCSIHVIISRLHRVKFSRRENEYVAYKHTETF